MVKVTIAIAIFTKLKNNLKYNQFSGDDSTVRNYDNDDDDNDDQDQGSASDPNTITRRMTDDNEPGDANNDIVGDGDAGNDNDNKDIKRAVESTTAKPQSTYYY